MNFRKGAALTFILLSGYSMHQILQGEEAYADFAENTINAQLPRLARQIRTFWIS